MTTQHRFPSLVEIPKNSRSAMTGTTTLTTAHNKTAHANGIDVHHLDVGSGRPLLLLHGGMVSTNPI
jgi:hypothetical protein